MVKSQKDRLKDFLPREINRIQTSIEHDFQNFLGEIETKEEQQSILIKSYRRIPLGCESFFMVLRRWNSYTPSLPLNNLGKMDLYQHSIGGGYFLYIEGKENEIDAGYGLVIDPGYNFIHNFGLSGFCIDDIDGILITHAHNDHTNDFESILSLLYQRNKKFKGKRKSKKVDLFLNVGSFKKFSNYLDLANKSKENYLGNVIVMSPGQVYKIPGREDLKCEILTLYTRHNEIVTRDYSLGICFKIYDTNLLLTSDTGWCFETAIRNQEFLEKNNIDLDNESGSTNIDVLVVHIGSIQKKEFDIKGDCSNIQEYFYESHLGILGVISAIEKYKPELCIISEFGEELVNLRGKLSDEIETTCRTIRPDLRCIPGDIGLLICLDSKQALCYASEKLIDWSELDYSDIKDDKSGQRSIYYYGKGIYSGLANKQELIQILKVKDGLKYLKNYNLEKIIDSFELNGNMLNEHELLKDFSELVWDCKDPFFNSAEYEYIGILFALSHYIENPLNILNVICQSNRMDYIEEFLEVYSLDTYLLKKFMRICGLNGISGPDSDMYENLRFLGNKQFMDDFIKYYCDSNEEKAKEALALIGTGTLNDGWEELSEERQIEIIIDCQGEFEEDLRIIELNDKQKKLGEFIQDWYDKKDKIFEFNKLFKSGKSSVLLDTTELEQIFDKEIDGMEIERLKSLIKRKEELETFSNKMDAWGNELKDKITEFLNQRVVREEITSTYPDSLFHLFYQILKYEANNEDDIVEITNLVGDAIAFLSE